MAALNSTLTSLLSNVTEEFNVTSVISDVSKAEPVVTTTILPPTMSTIQSTTNAATSTAAAASSGHSTDMLLLCFVIFGVAVALVVKVIVSNRKRHGDLIGGTARWRLAASQQSGAGPARTAASYAPMGSAGRQSGGIDAPGPDRTLDWERQFFDDSEPTEPSRLQLDFNRP